MIGADERVPFVRHDFYTSEWEAMGMILMRGYLDVRYFPIFISYCFIHYCLYGEAEENELIDRFLKYLTADERQIIDVVLKSDSNEVFSSEEFLDILEQFKCCSLVNRKNIREVVQELAKQELYQKPHLMASCWLSIFAPLRLKLPGSENLRKLYRDFEPTCKKLVAIINSKPENEAERECLHYLKKYVKSLDKPMLKHLLEFLTGSQFLVVDEIKVSFTKK